MYEPSPRVPPLKCPAIACSSGPKAPIYTARVKGPDGRQRAVAGCVKHFLLECGKALSAVQLEPFEETHSP